MKYWKPLSLAVILAALICAAPALAEPFTDHFLKLDVPPGWTVWTKDKNSDKIMALQLIPDQPEQGTKPRIKIVAGNGRGNSDSIRETTQKAARQFLDEPEFISFGDGRGFWFKAGRQINKEADDDRKDSWVLGMSYFMGGRFLSFVVVDLSAAEGEVRRLPEVYRETVSTVWASLESDQPKFKRLIDQCRADLPPEFLGGNEDRKK